MTTVSLSDKSVWTFSKLKLGLFTFLESVNQQQPSVDSNLTQVARSVMVSQFFSLFRVLPWLFQHLPPDQCYACSAYSHVYIYTKSHIKALHSEDKHWRPCRCLARGIEVPLSEEMFRRRKWSSLVYFSILEVDPRAAASSKKKVLTHSGFWFIFEFYGN